MLCVRPQGVLPGKGCSPEDCCTRVRSSSHKTSWSGMWDWPCWMTDIKANLTEVLLVTQCGPPEAKSFLNSAISRTVSTSFYNGIARRGDFSCPKNVLPCQHCRAVISSDCSLPRGQADLVHVLLAYHACCSHCCFPTLQILWHLAACLDSFPGRTKSSCRWRMCRRNKALWSNIHLNCISTFCMYSKISKLLFMQ